MTPTEIARLLHGRRYAKGRWFAKCPAHREKTGSLSITDMGGGRTRLHCFGGCDQRSVIDALGWKWSDLTTESKIDPEIMRRYAEDEAKRKAQKETRTRLLWEARKRLEFWERRVQVLGRSLMKWPEIDSTARDFNRAIAMTRRMQSIWQNL